MWFWQKNLKLWIMLHKPFHCNFVCPVAKKAHLKTSLNYTELSKQLTSSHIIFYTVVTWNTRVISCYCLGQSMVDAIHSLDQSTPCRLPIRLHLGNGTRRSSRGGVGVNIGSYGYTFPPYKQYHTSNYYLDFLVNFGYLPFSHQTSNQQQNEMRQACVVHILQLGSPMVGKSISLRQLLREY